MKKLRLILMPLLITSLVAACGDSGRSGRSGRNSDDEYSITFHQDEGYKDDVFTYYVGETTAADVKAFQDSITLNQRRGYDVKWEDYDVSNISSNLVVRALYSLHEYTITYKYGEEVLGTAKYTIESKDSDIVAPALPTTAGYTYAYDTYTVSGKAEDFTVQAHRDLVTYYATFVDIEGNPVGQPVPFTVESTEISEPAVPTISGKVGRWENYELGASDITIHPRYSSEIYKARFWSSNTDDKVLIAEVEFTENDVSIQEPACPMSIDYRDGKWVYTLEYKDLDIYPTYYKYHEFYISYKETKDSGSVLVEPTTFTYPTKTQTLLDGETYGYHTFWKYGDDEFEGGVATELEMHDYEFYVSRRVAKSYTITLNPAGGELPSEASATINVTFGEEYTLPTPTADSSDNEFYTWVDENDNPVALTGTWNLDGAATLKATYIDGASFETGIVPSHISIKQSIQELTITEEDATRGTHSLKFVQSASGDFGVIFSKEYLDRQFADPTVVAINFDAKGSVHSSNFRARIAGTNVTYENNSTLYGLDTEWKTFSFRREYYEDYLEGDAMIYGQVGQGNYVLVDNIHTVTEELDSFGFENGYLNVDKNTYMSSGHANSNPAPEQIFKALPSTGVEVSNIRFDYKVKSEGNRSLALEKGTGYVAFYLSKAIKESLGENGYVTFDLMTSVTINANPTVSNGRDGRDNPLGGDGYQLKMNTWIHLTIYAATGITSDGRFLIIQGSTAGTYHFDHIQLVPID